MWMISFSLSCYSYICFILIERQHGGAGRDGEVYCMLELRYTLADQKDYGELFGCMPSLRLGLLG